MSYIQNQVQHKKLGLDCENNIGICAGPPFAVNLLSYLLNMINIQVFIFWSEVRAYWRRKKD